MGEMTKKQIEESQKERIRRRVYTKLDPSTSEYIPANKTADYYDNEITQRVAIYVRVSTDNVLQTSSYELQKKYYEDFVLNHPNWTLVKIYADEGISGTSLAHRDQFNNMISDCRAGKIDMIVTKSVSRFSRNVVDCISMVRMLADLAQPVGVFFESECIFSLNEDSQMALSFQATMAQEESHTRSRSMESSLRMRLDGGLPLTPKLLGYSHDGNGQLVINSEEASTVKLIFYMYLYGYSTAEIADKLTRLGKMTYLGNVNWTSGTIVQVLRNERHCGDVRTRKTFTPNYLTHKARKNRGDRPQTIYRNHHEAIVTRDDYIAVQHLLDNSKYGNKSMLPELRIVDEGLLKGFITLNPRWAGFTMEDYYKAATCINSKSSNNVDESPSPEAEDYLHVNAGDFDMRDFEITRAEFFDTRQHPYITFENKKIKFNTVCVRSFGKDNKVELLINPLNFLFAVRTAAKSSKNAVVCSKAVDGIYYPKDIPCAAYYDTLIKIWGWDKDHKYRAKGKLFQNDSEAVYVFDINSAEAFIKNSIALLGDNQEVEKGEAYKPLYTSGSRVRAIPKEWVDSFGNPYYGSESKFPTIEAQDEADWKIRLEGQLYETGVKNQVTEYDVLKKFIKKELGEVYDWGE